MSSPVNVGDILAGKYQVERVLGVGGMGVVVAAKHLVLGERVAIKFLLPQALAREDVVKRFIQEGMAANRLRGEHIGRVNDFGKLPSGAPYLVMDYLDGKDLGAILREGGPLGVTEAVDYVVQACEALAEAHSANIIHRDLKPSNLFIVKRLDGSPSVKLIDFGISKIQLPNAEGPEGEMTATAVMMGSPLYMAPEQMASARDVDGRADIWSLGIILHTMLTGSPPFRAPSVMQIYELIVQGAPPIRKIRPDVPAGIEAAILKCLTKDRRQRYANVGELAAAIAEFGPPEARFNADRIKRIISARATQDSNASPNSDKAPGSANPPVLAVTPAGVNPEGPTSEAPASAKVEKGEETAPPVDSKEGVYRSNPESPSAVDPLGTDGPWDQRTHPPVRKGRPMALIAAVAALLIGAPVAYLVLRSNRSQGTPPLADAPSAQPSTSSAPSLAMGETGRDGEPGRGSPNPSVDPGSSGGPPLVSPAVSATPPDPSVSAKPHTDTPSAGRVHRPPPIPREKPHGGKSPDELFPGQK